MTHLYRTTISYDTPADRVSRDRVQYTLVAATPQDAEQQARTLFEKTSLFKDLLRASYDGVDITTRKFGPQKVRIPRLDGPDADKFTLTPQLSPDGRNLEFIVKEKPPIIYDY